MTAEITLKNVSVKFPVYEMDNRSLKKSIIKIGGNLTLHKNVAVVRALNNINIELYKGDKVGIIGSNGAGKSTLLKTIAGIYEPHIGHIDIKGLPTPLLDIGLGMNEDLSGYENIFLRGMFLGFNKKHIKTKINKIAEFSELSDYLNAPIRVYSDGMRLRLAFSIATEFLSNILLMDETILVGDANFINKARKRIEQSIVNSNIFLIATHSEDIIHNFCNKAIYLQQGKLKYFGGITTAFKIYKSDDNSE